MARDRREPPDVAPGAGLDGAAFELRVPLNSLRPGLLTLDESTSRYVVRVHRLRAGARLLVFDPDAALEADAVLLTDRLPDVQIQIAAPRPTTARPTRRVTLLQAVGKGDKPEQVVRDATVLGAGRVVFVETERCVARGAGAVKRSREHRVSVEAARQAGRGDLPELLGPLPFAAALEVVANAGRRVVLCWHPTALPLLRVVEGWAEEEELALLVGPEGGLSDVEIDGALAAGFRAATLGQFVLRTETAATVALGVVQSYCAAHGCPAHLP